MNKTCTTCKYMFPDKHLNFESFRIGVCSLIPYVTVHSEFYFDEKGRAVYLTEITTCHLWDARDTEKTKIAKYYMNYFFTRLSTSI